MQAWTTKRTAYILAGNHPVIPFRLVAGVRAAARDERKTKILAGSTIFKCSGKKR